MLRRVSGRTHQVMTGLSARSAVRHVSVVETTAVTFVRLTEEQIAWYVASGEGADKAGGYAIQGRAAQFIRHIAGSHSGIMGLPLFETTQLLQQAGIRIL